MNIYCDTCKEKLWYGQADRGVRKMYGENQEGILLDFLEKHEGCKLHCDNDYAGDYSGIDTSGYKKFKKEEEK